MMDKMKDTMGDAKKKVLEMKANAEEIMLSKMSDKPGMKHGEFAPFKPVDQTNIDTSSHLSDAKS